METKTELILTFMNSDGKHVTLRPKYFKQNLDKATIDSAMEKMASVAYLFQTTDKKTGQTTILYEKPLSAEYRVTQTHPIQ